MDHLKLILFLFLFSSSTVFASAADFSGQSPFFRNSAGTWINSKDFANQLSSNTLTYDGQYKVQSPTAGRSFPITVSRSANIDIFRLGGAVKSLAKVLGPVGVGLAIADLVCSTSDICDNGFGDWEIGADPEIAGFPLTIPTQIQYCTANSCPGSSAPTAAASCNLAVNVAKFWSTGKSIESSNETECVVLNNGEPFLTAPISQVSGCPENYVPSGGGCALQGSPIGSPPTDQDWDDREASMNDSAFVSPMHSSGFDLPVSAPDPFPPANTLVGEKTTTLKDGAGNTIGTQVETTTITLTDNSTVDSPNNFDIKEEKTVINYDINNNITDQSTTVNEAPPSEAPAEDDITFDDVTDTVLEEKEITAPLNTTSWGGGSCPAPIAMNTSVGNFEFDTQPFCDFAEALKPFILIVASILGAFIILRARKS
jgi:hypothetical protein